jgi:predicted ribosomally synthesized peptide with SipW-like signal peptide
MKLLRVRNIALAGVVSVAGMGLIGVGAHAVFTQNTVSAQTITAGTMNVTLYSTAAVGGNNTANLALANLGPTGSTFTTGDQLVTITNNAPFVVSEITATPGDTFDSSGGPTSPNSRLAAETYLCEVSSGEVIYNGLLSAAPAQGIVGTLAAAPGPGNTDNYTVNLYAGNATTACGTGTTGTTPNVPAPSGAPTLNNDAEGGVIQPTMTVSYTG